MKTFKLFIDGEFCYGSAEAFEDRNPVTGQVFATVEHANASDVDRAVKAAKRALVGPWGELSMQERGSLLGKVADRIVERAADFLEAEIADTGKPRGLAEKIDIPRAAANFQIFADQARSFGNDAYMQSTTDGAGAIPLCSTHAPRRRWGHLPVEPPTPSHDLESRSCARRWKHLGRQTVRGDPRIRDLAC